MTPEQARAATLLPPNSAPGERAIETAMRTDIDLTAVPTLKNPAICLDDVLPFLAWEVAVPHWDGAWTEAEKREAVAQALPQHFRKGTRSSLRLVLDRIDPTIVVVEWYEDPDVMAPFTFRLELPLAADSDVIYDEALVMALLRDIAAVKPLRAHMQAVMRLRAEIAGFIVGAAQIAGFLRLEPTLDLAEPLDPAWANYLQTEEGEPVRAPDGEFLETA